ncbi:sugar nucleotide-binding protein [Propionibacterium australiense]|uniref:dTDP-4-dehydrorhamnose reductase n=1 Tax=Propionibacterium australiense TaxID=119981 RepID=A0A383S8U4_9ACTN|nr:bifunctional dTDP-4-dehydrorhamnose 3,5-epimerase family protein/NAD(P)-dependent oxidoreductase [Propionibacterium australiense]RLP07099.1 NAD-dependent epimerase/dehydratase family protein [Propionibacterium australiense]RLP07867.1 NAD-dependent epimerase/dehydratase family protein [Propionibacterium australiense]SYZ33799.1 dTDP-4-dehydrorhamnose 3,5-epimerase [Propionibacterium australiense]VEH88776.1 Probable dTDP-4-dehydrorhamnose 3,5-epimerase [Propionibacterium australiense]
MTLEYSKQLDVRSTPIPDLLVIDLTVHGDSRGWFKENWQRAKMSALGLPDFGPVQNNISFNDAVGVTRGIHAEPWDKFVSLATGRVFGAWVDLRAGNSFGTVFTCEIDPGTAVFVPRGVGNAYQTLEPDTAYSYLVNDHWSPDAEYTFLNLADETAAIDWPIPLGKAILSDKDKTHPRLAMVKPFPPRIPRVLVTGCRGQLGRALMKQLAASGFEPIGVDLDELNISDRAAVDAYDWSGIDVIINAAAWTDVDGAETAEGRPRAWAANAIGPANLARTASAHGIVLVHVSSEYIFDGTKSLHAEDEPPSPLSVYGQSKAGGDAAVAAVPRHYLVRTSWVVGDGRNFVRTMADLAARGVAPSVVDDQIGRLTFTADLAAGIIHLLRTGAEFGTYNLSCEGEVVSWAHVAKRVYELTGHDPADVKPVTTEEYFAGKQAAPRPADSSLNLSKLEATGFTPAVWDQRITEYLHAHRPA